METTRIMALDIGTVRIGVALSDLTGTIAQPWAVIPRHPKPHLKLMELIEHESVTALVVGRPLTLRGEASLAVATTEATVAEIVAHLSLPLVWWDERLTTAAAQRHLIAMGMRRDKRKANIDKVAAALLLQSYLDSRRPVP